MKSLPRGPAGPGEVWPGASTDAPSPRKSSNKLFQGFRALGKAQTSCFKVSDASERLKQVVSRFPRPRKGSNKLFQGFRGLGASGTPAKFAWYGLLRYPANFPASEEAVRDAGQVCRVRAFEVPGLTSLPRQRPSLTPRGLGRVKQVFGSTIRGMKRASSVGLFR